MRPHKKLNIWEEVMKMIEEIYHLTAVFPEQEKFGIVNQMRRAAISVASNIAEGCARRSNQEKIQYLSISKGSLSEIDAQLEISVRLGFLSKDNYKEVFERIEKISRMLEGLIRSRIA